jgi:hypothetical protein
VILAQVPLAEHLTAPSDLVTAHICVVTFQADAVRSQAFEDEPQRGADRLGDVALAHLIDVHKAANPELKQVPVDHSNKDLCDKLTGLFVEQSHVTQGRVALAMFLLYIIKHRYMSGQAGKPSPAGRLVYPFYSMKEVY